MTRMWQRLFALVAILGILLAQGALAAYSCPSMLSAPETGVPCERMDMDSAPLCAKHCFDEKQKPHESGDGCSVPGFVAAYSVRIPDFAGGTLEAKRLPAQGAAPRPLIIRNCTLRI